MSVFIASIIEASKVEQSIAYFLMQGTDSRVSGTPLGWLSCIN